MKMCPLCGEKNFTHLSEHLASAHNLDRQEIVTLLAYTDQNHKNKTHNNIAHQPSMASVSSSSPTGTTTSMLMDKSPQQTPISINTNNQQITCLSSPTTLSDPINNSHSNNTSSLNTTTTTTATTTTTPTTASLSPNDQQSSAYLPLDGKKRLLCPRCDTWVLNLTDHLIKKHHLSSKQERLPFLRLARNRYATPSTTPTTLANGGLGDQTPSNSFIISPDHSSPTNNSSNQQQATHFQQAANRKYQTIVRKYRKKFLGNIQTSSARSSLSNNCHTSNHNTDNCSSYEHSTHSPSTHEVPPTATSLSSQSLLTMNSIQSLLNTSAENICKQEKFKFPHMNDNYTSRSFSTNKTSSGHTTGKDQAQV
jgi:hypothetical protein